MKIYLDDEREAPDGWVPVRNPAGVLDLLKENDVEAISLDHDLGWFVDEREVTGYTILCGLEEYFYHHPEKPLPKITVHSANPAVYKKMTQTIEGMEKRHG